MEERQGEWKEDEIRTQEENMRGGEPNKPMLTWYVMLIKVNSAKKPVLAKLSIIFGTILYIEKKIATCLYLVTNLFRRR